MATAKIKERKPKPRKVKVTLELSGKEARALHALIYRGVTGPPDGPRGQLNAISDALTKVGISSVAEGRLMSDTNAAWFDSYPPASRAA